MNRAVVYCRVSTEEQAENGTSLETQEISCTRKAAEIGAPIVVTCKDEGVSGGLFLTRPGIQKALCHIENGEANLLVVYSISRLSRDVEHQQIIRKRIERAGARLIVCDMPLEDTEEGELMFGMFGNFAQYERRLIRKRTMQGSRRQAEKGIQPCRSHRPYGYIIVTHKDVLQERYSPEEIGSYVVKENEAAIVRELFARYANGASLNGLCTWLNDAGVPTARNGECWRPRAVMYILQNPTYRGKATYGRTQVFEDEARTVEHGYKQTRYQRPCKNGGTVIIPAPPIVDEPTWFACEERMAENRAVMSGNPKRKRLLSGLARCQICGRGLASRSHKGHSYYICNRNGAETHKPNPQYTVEGLERDVIGLVVSAQTAPERIQAAFTAYALHQCKKTDATAEDTDALRQSIAELDKQETTTARAQVDALLKGRNSEVYDRLLSEIDAQRKDLQARLQAAQRPAEAPDTLTDPQGATLTVETALAALHKVLTADDVLTVAERREVLAGFVKEIVPTEEGIRLHLRPTSAENQTMHMGVVMYQVDLPIKFTLTDCKEAGRHAA